MVYALWRLNSLVFLHLATERIGFEMTGPTPALIFTSTPIPGKWCYDIFI